MSTSENLSHNVKRLRIAAGISQDELAKRAGLSSVSMVENGSRPNARTDTLDAIARALGVTVSDLFAEPPTVAPPTSERRRKPKPTPRARRRGVVRTKAVRVSE